MSMRLNGREGASIRLRPPKEIGLRSLVFEPVGKNLKPFPTYSYIWENGFKMVELVFLTTARNF